jgi:hypothetical protein
MKLVQLKVKWSDRPDQIGPRVVSLDEPPMVSKLGAYIALDFKIFKGSSKFYSTLGPNLSNYQ